MKQTTLVLGCTGLIGGRVAERLWDRGYRIRAGSRLADPAFDWSNPAGWPAVVEDVSAMYVTVPADLKDSAVEAKLARLLDLAVRGGVRRLVFHSRRGEPRSHALERVVQAAGMSWTIVRIAPLPSLGEPGSAEHIIRGEIGWPLGALAKPFIDADDAADAIVELLVSSGHEGRVYDLSAPGRVMVGVSPFRAMH